MRTARYNVTVVTVEQDYTTEVLVFGGKSSDSNDSKNVEKCTVK